VTGNLRGWKQKRHTGKQAGKSAFIRCFDQHLLWLE